jgi:ribosomal protein L16 Arg81 hydroxylase
MADLRTMVKRTMPTEWVHAYRRRRMTRRYLRGLAYELYDRQVRLSLEDFETDVVDRPKGFHDRLAKDVLARTDAVLQALDRKIEGVSARHGTELRTLREELEAARAEVTALRDEVRALLSARAGS